MALPALFILVFSTWTTNTVNLYSAVLTLAASFRRFSDKQLTTVPAADGMITAFLLHAVLSRWVLKGER